jgi:hypothetical protein
MLDMPMGYFSEHANQLTLCANIQGMLELILMSRFIWKADVHNI